MIENPELCGKSENASRSRKDFRGDLPAHEVHLWFAYPDEWEAPALIASARAVLETAEVARMERLLLPEARRLFLVSHFLVRMALSHYADRSPAQWRFTRNDHGKPRVDPAVEASAPTFSLAHTTGVAVVGVTRGRDIGVDVERRDRPVDARGLVRRFFSPVETVELGKLPSARLRDRFFLTWTLKEAYIKALGRGLSLPLRSFGFRLVGRRPYRIGFTGLPETEAEETGAWRFALIESRTPYITALGVASDPSRAVTIRCWRMDPSGEAAPLAVAPVGLSPGVICRPSEKAASVPDGSPAADLGNP